MPVPKFRMCFVEGSVTWMVNQPWSCSTPNGPWLSRLDTRGPEPKLYPCQRWSGTSARMRPGATPPAPARSAPIFIKSRRRISPPKSQMRIGLLRPPRRLRHTIPPQRSSYHCNPSGCLLSLPTYGQKDSEVELQSQLNLALRYHRAGDNACGPGAICHKWIRLRKHSAVEGVIELRAKFQAVSLGEAEVLPERYVSALLARAFQYILASIAETGACRHRKVIEVEPEIGSRVRKRAVADSVTPQQALTTRVGLVGIYLR